MYVTALALWVLFLIAAVFYTRRARNPRTRPLAAYLIFAAIFTISAFVIFTIIVKLVDALGRGEVLAEPLAAALFLVVVFVPAFLIARWQLRKRPHAPERPN